MLSRFSHVWLFVTLWTVARQAPLSVGCSRSEYWSGLPCPSSGSSQPRYWTYVSYVSCIGRQVLYHYCHLGSLWNINVEIKWLQMQRHKKKNSFNQVSRLILLLLSPKHAVAHPHLQCWLMIIWISQWVYWQIPLNFSLVSMLENTNDSQLTNAMFWIHTIMNQFAQANIGFPYWFDFLKPTEWKSEFISSTLSSDIRSPKHSLSLF